MSILDLSCQRCYSMRYISLGRKEVRKGKRGEKEFTRHLTQIYQNQNVTIWNNPLNWQGVDVVVRDSNGKPTAVFEVTNYSKKNWKNGFRVIWSLFGSFLLV